MPPQAWAEVGVGAVLDASYRFQCLPTTVLWRGPFAIDITRKFQVLREEIYLVHMKCEMVPHQPTNVVGSVNNVQVRLLWKFQWPGIRI